MRTRVSICFTFLAVLMAVLFVLDLCLGQAPISVADVWASLTGGDVSRVTQRIVLNLRLTKAITAVLAGAALSLSGLQMQTIFRNPLAGPYVLGISSGASLGVAIFILGAPLMGMTAWMSSLGVAGAAWVGAAAVLALTVAVARRIRDIMVILILGVMFSSGVSAVVQILQYLSREEALKTFVLWTMGSLGDVTLRQLWVFIPAVLCGLLLGFAAVKPLNLLLLGEDYARTMGLNVSRSRAMIFGSTTLLAGTVTAFCGPIGFIGLAMPHVTRLVLGNSDHRVMVPGTCLAGACVMLACDIVSKMLVLPVNAITALLGVPVVMWIVLRTK